MNIDVLNRLITTAQGAYQMLGNSAASAEKVLETKYALKKVLEDVAIDASFQKQTAPAFDGQVYDPLHDDDRMRHQLGQIFSVMMDGSWRTLAEISLATRQPEASVSAQLRHLRKPRFGSYVVEKRPLGARKAGCFQYRLLAADGTAIKVVKPVEVERF
jgi:hypothetical protein